jgi:hypothetical protein
VQPGDDRPGIGERRRVDGDHGRVPPRPRHRLAVTDDDPAPERTGGWPSGLGHGGEATGAL